MSSVVLIANGAAYGHESLFNALRLAIALKEQQSSLDLRLFLMSDAVVAGLTLPYSSGVVEGHVNRLKMLKRQMYGRAKPDLLRKRVLAA